MPAPAGSFSGGSNHSLSGIAITCLAIIFLQACRIARPDAVAAGYKIVARRPEPTGNRNMAFSYFLLNDCENGKAYLQLYRQYTKPEYMESEEETERMSRGCKD